jgi:hypothetical protein
MDYELKQYDTLLLKCSYVFIFIAHRKRTCDQISLKEQSTKINIAKKNFGTYPSSCADSKY